MRTTVKNKVKIKAAPLRTSVKRYPDSMPQYEIGHLNRVKKIKEETGRYPGIYLTGNAYAGVGIPDCIHHAEQTAQLMAEFLTIRHPERSEGSSAKGGSASGGRDVDSSALSATKKADPSSGGRASE